MSKGLCKRGVNAGRGVAGSHDYEVASGVRRTAVRFNVAERSGAGVSKHIAVLCRTEELPERSGGAARSVTNCQAPAGIAAISMPSRDIDEMLLAAMVRRTTCRRPMRETDYPDYVFT